jgi:5-methylcytosine-specific restriction endonuclease McrA
MPPSAVRTLQDLLYWQYAKIISGSSGAGKRQYAFVMDRFTKLRAGQISWDAIREYVKEREDPSHCLFCNSTGQLTLDHLVPRSLGGPHDEKNAVWVCASCNSSKGGRGLYEYWTDKAGLRGAKYSVPRIAEGKYLKLLHEVLTPGGYLTWTQKDLIERLCPSCRLHPLCVSQGSERKMSPLCLDAVAGIALANSHPAGS